MRDSSFAGVLLMGSGAAAGSTFFLETNDLMSQLNDPVNAAYEWAQIQAAVETYIADAASGSLISSGNALYKDAL